MAARVRPEALPDDAFLGEYALAGAYTDCFCIDVAAQVSQANFVEAFYTSPLFKLERLVLALLAASPSTDAQARSLAAGESSRFAAWTVECQDFRQLLLCDFQGRTRSWLMATPAPHGGGLSTRLHFGSAVVPTRNAKTGETSLGFPFRLLLGFHKMYSRALLRAAVRRLIR